MALEPALATKQMRLKRILQDELGEDKFEQLVAALVSRLLDVGIAIAKRGFQFGGDSGPGGRQGRRFRVETKRYADSTSLSHRELLGEVDHALQRDEALEGWFLAATKAVSEQLENELLQHAERLGVPIIVIDTKADDVVWTLTALCTVDPTVLDTMVSTEAGDIARALSTAAAGELDRLRRDCQSWQLGFESLRTASLNQLQRIWSTPKAAIAKLAQDAAGGSRTNRVRRQAVGKALDQWWSDAAASDVPSAVVGLDGVGKTWAGLDWLVERCDQQPIVLTIPASLVAGVRVGSAVAVKRLLAEQLCALTEVRCVDHWVLRLDRLFRRPAAEGPVLTLFFDGLNQVSEVAWPDLFRTLQDETFAGRIRLIATTRTYHFEERLRSLGLVALPPVRISVDAYDDAELDAMLAFENLLRGELHSELIPLARRPRLFALVVKFRSRLVEAGSITPHRLLWEYGKDTLGPQTGRSFTETEWREWLQILANQTLAKVKAFSTKALSETAARPDLSESEVFARLSDLIDGSFLNRTASGYEPTPAIVAHALGLALLNHLDALRPGSDPEAGLHTWLDTISGLDERAEVLRAAVSIMVGRAVALPGYAQTILLAWLQSQNIPDAHLADLIGLARPLAEALLSAIEVSSYVHRSARLWAVDAIRSLPRDDGGLRDLVIRKAASWLRIVSRDIDKNSSREAEQSRSARLVKRIGVDKSGPVSVLGTELELVDHPSSMAVETIPSLLEGFPLERALPVFEAAALASAVGQREGIWEGLKWLVLLNSLDRSETSVAIRTRSHEIAGLLPEPGVHADVPKRVAALLLWLNSTDEDAVEAAALRTELYQRWDYERDYLADPGKSFFTLERRHAEAVLSNNELTLFSRLDRSQQLWLDPTFSPPQSVVDELVASTENFPINELDTRISQTDVDYDFERNEPFLARGAPGSLGALVTRKLQGIGLRGAASRFWVAARILRHTIMWDASSVEPARQLRQAAQQPDPLEEAYVASNLVMMEVFDLAGMDQAIGFLAAGLGDNMIFEEIVAPISADDVDTLISRFGTAEQRSADNLATTLLLAHAPLSEMAWAWMLRRAFEGATEAQRSVAFRALLQCNAKRFGNELLTRDWGWEPGGPHLVNHYGSWALAEAADAIPFDQLAARIAPWLLLPIARKRGHGTGETLLAAQLLDKMLRPNGLAMPELGSQIVIYVERREENPFAFSLVTPPVEDTGDQVQTFRAMMDLEGRRKARKQAIETALGRIAEARKAGADLFLTSFSSTDFRALFKDASDLVEAWTEGASAVTADFKRRVLLAEGFYIALCEAAFEEQPSLGATLWRALRKLRGLTLIGRAKVAELIHIPFRVRQTPQSDEVLTELLSISNAKTDKDLMDLALAASVNGRNQWLEKVIEDDAASAITWRQRRADVLSGFRSDNSLPVDEAWPEGEMSGTSYRRYQAAKWRLTEASARRWWQTYLAAPDPAAANAAWALFLECADRRALEWVRSELPVWRTGDRLQRLKRAHVIFNYSALVRAAEKREKALSDNFLGQRTFQGISPWL